MQIKKSNVLMIFFEANTFKKEFKHKVNEVRTEKYRKYVKDEFPIPYCVTLASFACELFIKFLICVSGIQEDETVNSIDIPRGHDLQKLYNQLPDRYKKIVLDKIEKETLNNILKRNADAFMKWSYIYESRESSIVFNYDYINKFMDVLYEIANKKNTTWFGEEEATDVMMKVTDSIYL